MSLKKITNAIITFFKNILHSIQSFFGSIRTNLQTSVRGFGDFDNSSTAGKNLYALIVGINEYQNIRNLGGCVNDASRMYNYLKTVTEEGDFNFHPVKLTDQEATRANIIHQLKTHLTQAGENDVALFYFSGHGGQEVADDVWKKSEDDGLLETLVCHDSRNRKEKTPDLADKELRYLINIIAQKNPHIVIIADSCHSGDSSRSSELIKKCYDDVQADGSARISKIPSMRSWDKFCFADKITPEMVRNADALSEVMPEGNHIAFAACRDRELAFETNGAGVFTSTLLDVLKRSDGKITYYDLYARLKNTVLGRSNPQMPKIYASSDKAADMKQLFLGGASSQKPYFYNVSHNPSSKLGWIIDIGAIHGMPPVNADNNITINILDPKDISTVLAVATPKEVMPGYTTLRLIKDIEKRDYKATIDNLFLNPVNFYITGSQEGKDALNAYTTAHSDELKRFNINLVDNLAIADYMVVARKTTSQETNEIVYYIGKQTEESLVLNQKAYEIDRGDGVIDNVPFWKWSTQPCAGTDNKSLETLVGYMQHIARWQFLKRLKTPVKHSPIEKFIEVTFYQGKYEDGDLVEKTKLQPDEDNIIHLGFPYTSKGGKPLNHLLIDMKNTHFKHTVYAAMPALFNDFSIYTKVLKRETVEFAPEYKASANEGNSLPYKMSNYVQDFNYEHISIFFKLIVSASDFDVSSFAQKGLPLPTRVRSKDTEGFADFDVEVGHVTKTDWIARTYEVRFKNPFYVKPPDA